MPGTRREVRVDEVGPLEDRAELIGRGEIDARISHSSLLTRSRTGVDLNLRLADMESILSRNQGQTTFFASSTTSSARRMSAGSFAESSTGSESMRRQTARAACRGKGRAWRVTWRSTGTPFAYSYIALATAARIARVRDKPRIRVRGAADHDAVYAPRWSSISESVVMPPLMTNSIGRSRVSGGTRSRT